MLNIFFYLFLFIIVQNKSIAKNRIIKLSDIIKIILIELAKKTQSKVMIMLEINAPIMIAMKLFQTFKVLKPAIKLPVQTPVSGSGIATKHVSIRYRLKLDVCRFILSTLTENFFEFTRKPLVLDFINFVVKIIARHGSIDPKKPNKQASQAGRTLTPQKAGLIANGIAILASNVGIIARIIQASQIHP